MGDEKLVSNVSCSMVNLPDGGANLTLGGNFNEGYNDIMVNKKNGVS
jgi:hypothetical protein